MATIDLIALIERRDHHLNEARRCDDAIALLKEVGKTAAHAQRITGKVMTRATGAPPPQPMNARDFVRKYHDPNRLDVAPHAEARRLHILAQGEGIQASSAGFFAAVYAVKKELKKQRKKTAQHAAPTQQAKANASKYRRKAELKRAGQRPMDRFRRVFRDNPNPITRDDAIVQARLAEVVPAKYVRQSAAKVLEAMITRKEIKRHGKNGEYVAYRLPPATAPDTANNGQPADAP